MGWEFTKNEYFSWQDKTLVLFLWAYNQLSCIQVFYQCFPTKLPQNSTCKAWFLNHWSIPLLLKALTFGRRRGISKASMEMNWLLQDTLTQNWVRLSDSKQSDTWLSGWVTYFTSMYQNSYSGQWRWWLLRLLPTIKRLRAMAAIEMWSFFVGPFQRILDKSLFLCLSYLLVEWAS